MRKGIVSKFNSFKAARDDGALMGPWNPWLHEPDIGKAIWDPALAMTANATLADKILPDRHPCCRGTISQSLSTK